MTLKKYKIVKSSETNSYTLYKRTRGLIPRILCVSGVFIPLFGLLLPNVELRAISLTTSLFSGMLLSVELMTPDFSYIQSFSSIKALHEYIAEQELKEDDEVFYL